MTEPVKPINGKTPAPQAPALKPQEPQNVKIGGVSFKKDHVENFSTYNQNGVKMNTVFVKPGVQIDYPDQTNPKLNPSVESRGLRNEWYNPDDSHIHIDDIENATIYGNPNKTDFIELGGKSKNNTVIVDQKESWYIDGSQRHDFVELGEDTSDNTVKMDEKDHLDIFYHQIGVSWGGRKIQSEMEILNVQGAGTSEQEPQLKASIKDYQGHKLKQQLNDKKSE